MSFETDEQKIDRLSKQFESYKADNFLLRDKLRICEQKIAELREENAILKLAIKGAMK